MSKSIPNSSIISYTETNTGLLLTGTVNGGTLPTTAGTFAPGAKIMDLVTSISWTNVGTTAVPVWQSESLSVVVPLTAAQIIALYTTSIEVIPAVAGKSIILDSLVFDLTGTATQFTGGGVVNLQYKNTANGAGTTLHADIAASVVTGATAQILTHRIPKDLSSIAIADIQSQGVFIGAKTAVFATGTGTANVRVRYHLV